MSSENRYFVSFSVFGATSNTAVRSLRSLAAPHRAHGCITWGESFTLTLTRADVSVLYVSISSSQATGGQPVAYFAVPIIALRAGFRSLPLRDPAGKKIPLCTLLARFQRREIL